jgi:predicted nucleic acid-binding protein
MPYFTYDTSVIISRKLTDLQRMPQSFLMSAVVLMELMAGAKDRSRQKVYEGLFRYYQGRNLLIVPTVEDWFLVGKILYLLTHSRKLLEKGKLRRLSPGVSQKLAVDALIAASARRWKAQVVTENWTDFKAIQRYCDTTIVRAATFFKK